VGKVKAYMMDIQEAMYDGLLAGIIGENLFQYVQARVPMVTRTDFEYLYQRVEKEDIVEYVNAKNG
jgi:hypothetical protein